MNPRYNEQISLRVPWHFVKLRFQSIKLFQQFFKEMYEIILENLYVDQ